jgi:hypothetical protein
MTADTATKDIAETSKNTTSQGTDQPMTCVGTMSFTGTVEVCSTAPHPHGPSPVRCWGLPARLDDRADQDRYPVVHNPQDLLPLLVNFHIKEKKQGALR